MATPVDGFIVVKRRARRRNKYQGNCDGDINDDHERHCDTEAVKIKVDVAKKELEYSAFYKDFQDAWIQSKVGKYTSYLSKSSAEMGSSSTPAFVSHPCTLACVTLKEEAGWKHEACSGIISNIQDSSHIWSNGLSVESDEYSNCRTAYNNSICTDSSLCSSNATQDFNKAENVSSALSRVNINNSCTASARLPAAHVISSHCGLEFRNSICGNDSKCCYRTSHPKKLICYGLGRFSSCVTSRYQFALLLLLREHLQIEPDHCFMYDPVFSEQEKGIIHDLGFQLIQENEEGKHYCCSCTDTVFYMPHCGKAMYNNLVWANWSLRSLSHIVVIGNSFHTMVDSMLERHASKEISYIFKLYHYVNEVPVKNSFQYTDIFNDHNIHTFPEDTLATIPDKLWSHCDEPVYSGNQHEEIIRKMTA